MIPVQTTSMLLQYQVKQTEQSLPLTGDDEVTFAHTQTLTNKSLTTPTINAPKIPGLSGVVYTRLFR